MFQFFLFLIFNLLNTRQEHSPCLFISFFYVILFLVKESKIDNDFSYFSLIVYQFLDLKKAHFSQPEPLVWKQRISIEISALKTQW